MSTWSFYNLATGEFVGQTFTGPQTFLASNTPDGFGAMEGLHNHLSARVDLGTGEVIDFQPPAPADDPRQTWAWDDTVRRWVASPTLQALQDRRWEDMKVARAQALTGTFECGGLVYQIDRDNIPGAALDALIAQQAGEPWQQTWVLADNTTAVLDAAGMIAVGRALKAAISTIWAAGESVRTKIYAAQSQQELDEIQWQFPVP